MKGLEVKKIMKLEWGFRISYQDFIEGEDLEFYLNEI